MIQGIVTEDGLQLITIEIAGKQWPALIDTGFNGDLELPESLMSHVNAEWAGTTQSFLAAGQVVEEESYTVEIPFDGQTSKGEASFAPGGQILIGTRLLKHHRLEVDFPARAVRLERAA